MDVAGGPGADPSGSAQTYKQDFPLRSWLFRAGPLASGADKGAVYLHQTVRPQRGNGEAAPLHTASPIQDPRYVPGPDLPWGGKWLPAAGLSLYRDNRRLAGGPIFRGFPEQNPAKNLPKSVFLTETCCFKGPVTITDNKVGRVPTSVVATSFEDLDAQGSPRSLFDLRGRRSSTSKGPNNRLLRKNTRERVGGFAPNLFPLLLGGKLPFGPPTNRRNPAPELKQTPGDPPATGHKTFTNTRGNEGVTAPGP